MSTIATVYNRYLFRSRRDARWAVFFDALSIRWEYRKKIYGPDGAEYIPDFYLPGMRCFINLVSLFPPPDTVCEMAEEIALRTGCRVFIFDNMPDVSEGDHGDSAYAYLPSDGEVREDNNFAFCECRECGLIGIEYQGRSARLPCKDKDSSDTRDAFAFKWGCTKDSDRDHNYDSDRLLRAYDDAFLYRFLRVAKEER